MRVIYKIAKSELGTLFYSPIAWLILVIFVFQVFGSFANLLEYTVNAKTLGQMQGYQSYMLFVIGGFAPYTTIQSTLYLYIPLLTMGLMSREYKGGGTAGTQRSGTGYGCCPCRNWRYKRGTRSVRHERFPII